MPYSNQKEGDQKYLAGAGRDPGPRLCAGFHAGALLSRRLKTPVSGAPLIRSPGFLFRLYHYKDTTNGCLH